jgi:hypothetical protein
MSRLQQNPWYLPGLSTARIAWPGITASRKLERGAGAKFCTCGKATIVLTTRTTEHGDIWRVRECACGSRYETLEVAIARGNRKEEEA